MKHVDPNLLRKAREKETRTARDIYVARGKHKALKKTFKGIMSYPQRKILHQVGQRGR